jgi:hypothetical protein
MTFVTALRLGGVTAPWLLDGAMDGDACRTYIEHVLVPTLEPGDIVVVDNLPAQGGCGPRRPPTSWRASLLLAALLARHEPD